MAYVTRMFASPAGVPNCALWPSGTVPVTIYARVESPTPGVTYTIHPRLYRGQNQGEAWGHIWDTGTDSTPAVTPQALTETWTLYTFSVPVRELTGPTSDRAWLYVVGTGGPNYGGIIHIGSDGGSNQTAVLAGFEVTPAVPRSLKRNPDEGRSTNTVTIAIEPNGQATLGTFYAQAGDPGLALWRGKVWRLRIWARTGSNPVTITCGVCRQAVSGGAPTLLATSTIEVTEIVWTLHESDVFVPESSGDSEDTVALSVAASSVSGATLSIGVGLDNPSSINAPLIPPPGGTTTSPTGDDKTRAESGAPRGYIRELTASSDGSIEIGMTSDGRMDLKVGRVHTPYSTATLVGSGTTRKVVMPLDSSRAELILETSEVIYGIAADGYTHGDSIKILVRATSVETGTFVHLNEDLGDGSAMDLYEVSGTGKNITIDRTKTLNFTLDANTGCWRLER